MTKTIYSLFVFISLYSGGLCLFNHFDLTEKNKPFFRSDSGGEIYRMLCNPPVASCKNATVNIDAQGNANFNATDIDNGSQAACGFQSITANPHLFFCTSIFQNPHVVTLTVTDQKNSTASCTASVKVVDHVPPTALCQDLTVNVGFTGFHTILPQDIGSQSSDACGISSMTTSHISFTCIDTGLHAVTLMVEDPSSNFNSCTSQVRVKDTTPPLAICQNHTVYLDAFNQAAIVASDIDNNSWDPCGLSMRVAPNTFSCAHLGSNIAVLELEDASGSINTCTGTVFVEDSTKPTAICQNISLYLNGAGQAFLNGAELDNQSFDNCGIATWDAIPNHFDCDDLGSNPVSLLVTDFYGNTASCLSQVWVRDTTPPTAVCQNLTAYLDVTGNVSIVASDVDGGSADACGLANMTVLPEDFSCLNVGANTATLWVEDSSGRQATCTGTITVTDTTPPIAICQDHTVYLDAQGQANIQASDVDNNSWDPCGFTMTVSPQTFSCLEIGANTTLLQIIDWNGNAASCTGTITVRDTLPLLPICQNITLTLDVSGEGVFDEQDILSPLSRLCDLNTVTVAPSSFACQDVGNNTVSLTVSDFYGNTASCLSQVWVRDTTPPTAVCQNLTAYLDVTGAVSIVASDVDGGSADACGLANMTVLPEDFSCLNVGANTTVLTLQDPSGRQATCTGTVTVIDTMPPIAICQNLTLTLDSMRQGVIQVGDIDDNSFDGCGLDQLTLDITQFDTANIGLNLVTLSILDVNGNVSSCQATVTVRGIAMPAKLAEQGCIACGEIHLIFCQGAPISPNLDEYLNGIIEQNDHFQPGNSLYWYKDDNGMPGSRRYRRTT